METLNLNKRDNNEKLVQQFLSGPVMSDEQYEEYLNLRKDFEIWKEQLLKK